MKHEQLKVEAKGAEEDEENDDESRSNDDVDEPPSEDLDDDDDDGLDQDDDEPDDLINAHYKKVARTKSKYKCDLQDVMIHIKGRDYIVKSMTADISFN